MPPQDKFKTPVPVASDVKSNWDRRRFMIGSAIAGLGGVAAAALRDGELGGPPQTFRGAVPWQEGTADAPPGASGSGYIFFTPTEVALVDAAVGRLIPDDPVGPGAVEAGVTFFLDRQLAGKFGRGDHYFLGGPWPKGTPEQGYPASLPPSYTARPWRQSTSTPGRPSTARCSANSRQRIRTRC